jgi:hypothetical protein
MRSFTLFQKQKEKKGQPAGRIHVDPFFLGFKKKKKKTLPTLVFIIRIRTKQREKLHSLTSLKIFLQGNTEYTFN